MGRNLRGDMRCGRRGCRCAALATWRGAPAQLGGREAGRSCQHCHPSTLRWEAGEPWDVAHVGNTQQHLCTTAVAVYFALLFSSSTTGACSFISATSAAVLPSAFLMPTSAPLREAEQEQQQQQHRQQLFTSS